MELREPVRDDRYARFPVELHRRTDLAGRGGACLCRSSNQLCPAQTLDQACLRRDLFLERKWPSVAISSDGGVRSKVMSLDAAITNLASWAGNTMMPTM